MDNKKKKQNQIIKVTALLGLFLLVFGVSYALFSVVLEGTKKNKISTGNLSLELLNESGNTIEGDVIGLENAVPVLNEEGMQNTPYTFTIRNNGTLDTEFSIKLEDVDLETGEERLADKNVKTHLVITNEKGEAIESTPIILSAIENRILDAGVISPGKSRSYKLYLWVDAGADNSAMNKVFNAKLKLEGTQVNNKTASRTILRRINIDGENDRIGYFKNKLKIYTAGYGSATIYEDGTVRLIGEEGGSIPYHYELYNDEKYISYAKEILTLLGFDVSNLNTREELKAYTNSIDWYTDNFDEVYKSIWEPIIIEAGGEVDDTLIDLGINDFIKEYAKKDVEAAKKMVDAYMEKTGVLMGFDLFTDSYQACLIKNIYQGNNVGSTYSDFNYIQSLTFENELETLSYIESNFITELTLPKNISWILGMTTPNIKEIFIPNTVEKIYSMAFYTWTSDQTIRVDFAENDPIFRDSTWKGNANVIYLR